MSIDYAEILDTLQEKSQEGRDLVFRHVADLFLSGNAPKDSGDRAKLSEILRILRPKVNLGIRRELSGHLYSMEAPPLELLEVLLEDVDSVSGPLLDYAAIPRASLDRLIDHAPIEIISRLKRRKDLSAAAQERLNARFKSRLQHSPPDSPSIEEPQQELSKNKGQPPASPEPVPVTSPSSGAAPRFTTVDVYPDLDDLNLATADIHARNSALRDFTRVSGEWQWETDRRGNLIYLSAGAARALGRPVSTLVELPFSDLVAVASNDRTEQNLALAQALERRSAFDDVTFTAGQQAAPMTADIMTGDTVTWELAGVPKFNLDTGRFQGYRGMARPRPDFEALRAAANGNNPESANDTGQRVPRAKAAGSRANTPRTSNKTLANLEVADTIQNLSHELRTPLNAILGFSEMIQLETWGKINEKYKENVSGIMEAAQQLYELINDILENAKLRQQLDELYPKSFSISSALNEAIETVAPQATRRRVTLTAEDKGLRAIVYSDARLVHYTLVRLLRCALNSCAENSSVTMTLKNRDDGSVVIAFAFRKPSSVSSRPEARQNEKPALYEFCLSLARELAQPIGATIIEERPGQDIVQLSLCLPPHERFPGHDRF